MWRDIWNATVEGVKDGIRWSLISLMVIAVLLVLHITYLLVTY